MGGERGDYISKENMLLDDLEGAIKRFRGGNNVCAISDLEEKTMENGGKSTVAGVVGAISATYDGFVAPCETGAKHGGMPLIYTEDTDSIMRLASV